MLFFPYIVEEVNTNRHQCKRSSKKFIIGKQTMIEIFMCLNSPYYLFNSKSYWDINISSVSAAGSNSTSCVHF